MTSRPKSIIALSIGAHLAGLPASQFHKIKDAIILKAQEILPNINDFPVATQGFGTRAWQKSSHRVAQDKRSARKARNRKAAKRANARRGHA